MKLLLSLLPLLLASVACLPLPEEIVPVEIKSELKSEENPIITIKDTVQLEAKSAAFTEKPVDNNNADKNVDEKITPTNNIETLEQKLIKTPKVQETKDSKENKVVIIEAKSVVNKEPELLQKMSTEDIKSVSEKKIEIHEDKIETPSDIKETPVVLIKENLKADMPAEKQVTEKNSELDAAGVASNVKENMDSNESKVDILSDPSKESTESQGNKS